MGCEQSVTHTARALSNTDVLLHMTSSAFQVVADLDIPYHGARASAMEPSGPPYGSEMGVSVSACARTLLSAILAAVVVLLIV